MFSGFNGAYQTSENCSVLSQLSLKSKKYCVLTIKKFSFISSTNPSYKYDIFPHWRYFIAVYCISDELSEICCVSP